MAVFVEFVTFSALGVCSHADNSPSRNRHCRPIVIAGNSLPAAHRQIVRVDTPSHLATAAVVRSGSRLDNNFSMTIGTFHLWFSSQGECEMSNYSDRTRPIKISYSRPVCVIGYRSVKA